MEWKTPTGWAETGLNDTGKGWPYETESLDSGTVTLAQVQHAVFHRYLRRTGLPLEELLEINPKHDDIMSRTSRVHVYDIDPDTPLSKVRVARCTYQAESHVYSVWELEDLRNREYRKLQEKKEDHPRSRLNIVENISPPVMEILGSSLNLPAIFFKSHVAASWDGGSELLGGSVEQDSDLSRSPTNMYGTPIIAKIPFPRLFEVYHPSAWKVAEWRMECLRRAARHLQCRQLLPIIDHPHLDLVQCIAFEHNSVHIKHISKTACQATILFSPTVVKWSDGSLVVKRDRRVTMRLPPPLLTGDLEELNLHESDAMSWIEAFSAEHRDKGDENYQLKILNTLLEEALYHWNTFLVHITRTVELLSGASRQTAPGMNLLPQQQVKALVVQGSSHISDISYTIQSAIRTVSVPAPHLVEQLEELQDRFGLIKNQLQNHLPTLQHHIDIIVQKQQFQLQETQLEESRKAIQQADTIKRLTILAFVYIPVQTASSIFGMNVSELRPDTPVWIFAVTAIIMLSLTITVAAWKHLLPLSIYVVNNFGEATRRACRATVRPFSGCFGGDILQAGFLRARKRNEPLEPSWII